MDSVHTYTREAIEVKAWYGKDDSYFFYFKVGQKCTIPYSGTSDIDTVEKITILETPSKFKVEIEFDLAGSVWLIDMKFYIRFL